MKRHYLATAALIASAALGTSSSAQTQPKPPPAVVRVAQITKQNVEVTKTFVGTVMPLRKSVLGSAVDGRVAEVFVNEGDQVKARQPVAQILTKTIEAEVAAAEAQLDLRKQELAEMQNGTRKEELEAAVAREDAAKAVAEYAMNKFRRVEGLAKRGQANEGEVEEAMSNANQLQKLFIAAKAARELAEAGPRAEQIAQAKAREATAMHELERLRDMMSKYTVRAPFDGYVTAEHTEIGAWVNKADPVVEVIELKQVDVMVMVPETDVENVTLGQKASVRIDALLRGAFEGTVALIVPQADLRSRSMPVKIRVDNQEVNGQPVLKAGMSARGIARQSARARARRAEGRLGDRWAGTLRVRRRNARRNVRRQSSASQSRRIGRTHGRRDGERRRTQGGPACCRRRQRTASQRGRGQNLGATEVNAQLGSLQPAS